MKKKTAKPGGYRPGIRWSEDKVALLKMLYPINHNEAVAKALGCTIRSVRSAAIRYRLNKSGRYWTKNQEQYLLKNWDVMTAAEIAEKLKRTRWAVINKYRELCELR